MSKILVIDKDIHNVEKLKLVLTGLNEKNEVAGFTSFAQLDEAFKLADVAVADYFNFNLLILDYSLFKPTEWITKIDDFRKKSGGLSVVCFAAFENEISSNKVLKNLNIFNVFYRPFDMLILKESLNIALNHGQFVQTLDIKPQSPQAYVSFLKELEILSINELGFTARNNQPLKPGSLCNYRGSLFENGKKQNVNAKCLNSIEEKNNPGFHIGAFHYVGIQPALLKKIRNYIYQNKDNKAKNTLWNLDNVPVDRKLAFAVVDFNGERLPGFSSDLISHYKNLVVDVFDVSVIGLQPNKVLSAKKYDGVFILNQETSFEDLKKWFSYSNQFYLIAETPLDEPELEKALIEYVDVFESPLDNSYFYKKLKILNPDLNPIESYTFTNITTNSKIKAAQPVKVGEMTEIYLNFDYHRMLPISTFREIAFINEDENDVIEIPAFCFFVEKLEGTNEDNTEVFRHQFVFWGTTDHYLKQIRLWLLNTYISKQKN